MCLYGHPRDVFKGHTQSCCSPASQPFSDSPSLQRKVQILHPTPSPLYGSTQAALGETERGERGSLQGHGSLEEVSFAKDGLNVGEKSGCTRRDRKDQSVLSPSWPLTVQAWTSFRAKDAVQTLLQGESSMASVRINKDQKNWPQVENGKEEAKPILPCPVRDQADASFAAKALGQDSFEGTSALEDLFSKLSQGRSGSQRGEESQVQGSAETSLEPSQDWRNTERCPGDKDLQECVVMNFARQVDC